MMFDAPADLIQRPYFSATDAKPLLRKVDKPIPKTPKKAEAKKTSSTSISDFLGMLHPEGVFEIRIPDTPDRKNGSFKSTASGYFNNCEAAARNAKNWGSVEPAGIYVTINPVDPALLGRSANKISFRAKHTTLDSDIVRRNWILLDIDPERAAGTSATDSEMHEATETAKRIRSWLSDRGWPEPVCMLSGNGAYLLYRVDMPNDDESMLRVKTFIHAIAARFDSKRATVDKSVFNASRIAKVAGTWARKGDAVSGIDGIEDRPHRQAVFVSPETIELVPNQLIESVNDEFAAAKSENEVKADTGNATGGGTSSPAVVHRCRSYLQKMEIAVEGNHGHDRILEAAATIGRFGLSAKQGWPLLQDFNSRCLPPFSEHDLRRKLDEGIRKATEAGEFGKLRDSKSRLAKTQGNEESRFSFLAEEGSGLTDLANAKRFVDAYKSEILFVPEWKKWLSWDGQRWANDSGVGVRQRAHQYAESLWAELGKVGAKASDQHVLDICRFVKSTNQANKIKAFLELAQVDNRIVCPAADLNANRMTLNVQNGTIDLETGQIRPHDPLERLTQLAAAKYDADATCPKWLETLRVVFDGDAELIRWIQQILGYAITGDTGEHILPTAWGHGQNGKSTIWSVVVGLLGDYGSLAPESLLMGDKQNHPTEIAQLYQKRFVAISEPEMNAKLREARVKELTGDRQITARRMHEDFWTFERTHTFWLSTNHKPRISGTDHGIWRRVKLIPFTVDITQKVEKVPDFDRWLVANEGAGILAWLIRGYMDYRENGFVEPRSVREATDKFKTESDVIGQFIEECCETGSDLTAGATELFELFKSEVGGKWTQTAFGKSLVARGFEKGRGGKPKRTIYHGIAIKDTKTGEETEQTVSNYATASESETQQFAGELFVDTVGHTHNGSSREGIVKPKATGRLCPTVSKRIQEGEFDHLDAELPTCDQCGGRVVRRPVPGGYVNFDCESCDQPFGCRKLTE